MSFNIALVYTNNLCQNNKYLKEIFNIYDQGDYLLYSEICDLLQESQNVKIIISGFEKFELCTNESFEMCCAMEQIVDILKEIKKDNYNFTLDFYEQGVETILSFSIMTKNVVKIECLSLMEQKPISESLYSNKENIKNCFIKLYKDFIFVSRQICGYLLYNPIMKEFLNFEEVLSIE